MFRKRVTEVELKLRNLRSAPAQAPVDRRIDVGRPAARGRFNAVCDAKRSARGATTRNPRATSKKIGVTACAVTPRRIWLRGLDLNQRPLGYENTAVTFLVFLGSPAVPIMVNSGARFWVLRARPCSTVSPGVSAGSAGCLLDGSASPGPTSGRSWKRHPAIHAPNTSSCDVQLGKLAVPRCAVMPCEKNRRLGVTRCDAVTPRERAESHPLVTILVTRLPHRSNQELGRALVRAR
jgi:hypothetical protein